MRDKLTCKEWYERNYKGIWDDRTMNEVALVDAWRRYLMEDAKPSDWMDKMPLAEYENYMRRRMGGE